jgi:cytochrome c
MLALRIATVSACLTLAAASLGAGSAWAQDADAGKKIFNRCAACHDLGEKNKIGPHLEGLFGRTAGSLPDFNYSPAMKEAGEKGLVWNEETLDQYLTDPKGFIPKNRMAFAGLKKEDDRANVIAYLKEETGS